MTTNFAELVADAANLRANLEGADIVPLAMVLVQLTGDTAVLDALQPYVTGPWDYSEKAPEPLKREIRERLVETFAAYAADGRPLPPLPSGRVLQSMMSVAVGQPVLDDYAPMMQEDMALSPIDPKSIVWRGGQPTAALKNFRVIVIGAGMSGLCAAIKLREAGIPFAVYEKNDQVGGTWYENAYPGCGVDTPNHFYSFSFALNHDWSRFYSKRDELRSYFQACAERHELEPRITFQTEVVAACFDEGRALWRVRLRGKDGQEWTDEANAVISAVGQLNRPQVPDIAGLDRFRGPAFHTARWESGQSLKGLHIAMIGTGASGMQAGPALAEEAARLTIFQRSPHWVVSNPNYHRQVSDAKKWVLRHVPFYVNWYRFQLFWGFADGLHASLQIDPDWPDGAISINAVNERHRRNMIRHINREIGDDPDLLRKVVPNYPPYGKRILIDNHWYRMLKRDNVALVTDPIARIEPRSVVTADGEAHRADLIVFATGFHARRMLWPMDIRGRAGRALRDLWGEDDPRAYLGITVPGFPNFFVLYGPNTNLGHGGSAIFHTECQVRYTMLCLREMIEGGHATMECRGEAHDAYGAAVDRAHERMVWSHKGMNNWYKNRQGRVTANSPWRLVDYWRMTAKPDLTHYVLA